MSGKKRIILILLTILAIQLTMLGYFQGASQAATVYKRGSQGEMVRQIQQRLKDQAFYTGAVDGVYGEATEEAVRKYQTRYGLTADGAVGQQTLASLGLAASYKRGSTGDMVKKIQQKLKDLGYYTGAVDGSYGAATEAAVKRYQAERGLTADGVAGGETLGSLGLLSGASGGNSQSNSLYLLSRIISAEGRGEPYNGQIAIGAVVLNRVKHPSFPNTIAGVIYQPGAFSALNDGQFDQPIADISRRAAQDALNGVNPIGASIYYYNPVTATNQWIRSRPIVKTIGNHVFCT